MKKQYIYNYESGKWSMKDFWQALQLGLSFALKNDSSFIFDTKKDYDLFLKYKNDTLTK
jgi:hypothetical protein